MGLLLPTVTELEQAILNALVEIETTERQLRAANMEPDLTPLLECIKAVSAKLPPTTHPTLRKLLAKRDYHQARLWLEKQAEPTA